MRIAAFVAGLVIPSMVLAQTITITGTVQDPNVSAPFSVMATKSGVAGNCGMQLGGTAIFCEPFDVANQGTLSRTGALDPNVWGVSRTTQNVNSGQQIYNGWAPTQLQTCSGMINVTPPNDITICNGQLREASNDNPTGVFDQGVVTVLAMYPKQPFDFAGRTGTVAFDISNDGHSAHSAWPEFWMSDLPVPAPWSHFDTWQALPQHGFGLRLSSVALPGQGGQCQNQNNFSQTRWTVEYAVVVRNYVMEEADTNHVDAGTPSNPPLTLTPLDCVIAPPDNSGIMNHIEVRVNQSGIDVYATDAGVAPSPATLRKIASVTNANLTFTRGLVWLDDVHYNADKALEFGAPAPSQRVHTFVWDNLAFDGPFTYRDFAYDALDNTTLAQDGSINLGQFSQAGASASWNVPNMPANRQAAVVRVLFNFFHELPPTTVTVTVNGHAHSVPWPYSDQSFGRWRTYAVTIPVTDLVAGTNVVTIGADQKITSANVDIVLVNVPGGIPVLPGNSRAYPH